jgi:small subunit ribosomal protein S10
MATKKTTKKVATKKATARKATAKKATAKKAASKKAAAKKAPKVTGEIQKLRIRVRAYEHKILDASVKQIIDTAMRFDATVVGPIPLPTEVKKYTVNRSSFVYKDAREQFEMRMHKRVIDIMNPGAKVIEALTNLSLPSGVSIDVKMM